MNDPTPWHLKGHIMTAPTRDQLDAAHARAEHAERQLRHLATAMATLRGAARELVSQCECRGTGEIPKQRGFLTVAVACTRCLPLREALDTDEIV